MEVRHSVIAHMGSVLKGQGSTADEFFTQMDKNHTKSITMRDLIGGVRNILSVPSYVLPQDHLQKAFFENTQRLKKNDFCSLFLDYNSQANRSNQFSNNVNAGTSTHVSHLPPRPIATVKSQINKCLSLHEAIKRKEKDLRQLATKLSTQNELQNEIKEVIKSNSSQHQNHQNHHLLEKVIKMRHAAATKLFLLEKSKLEQMEAEDQLWQASTCVPCDVDEFDESKVEKQKREFDSRSRTLLAQLDCLKLQLLAQQQSNSISGHSTVMTTSSLPSKFVGENVYYSDLDEAVSSLNRSSFLKVAPKYIDTAQALLRKIVRSSVLEPVLPQLFNQPQYPSREPMATANSSSFTHSMTNLRDASDDLKNNVIESEHVEERRSEVKRINIISPSLFIHSRTSTNEAEVCEYRTERFISVDTGDDNRNDDEIDDVNDLPPRQGVNDDHVSELSFALSQSEYLNSSESEVDTAELMTQPEEDHHNDDINESTNAVMVQVATVTLTADNASSVMVDDNSRHIHSEAYTDANDQNDEGKHLCNYDEGQENESLIKNDAQSMVVQDIVTTEMNAHADIETGYVECQDDQNVKGDCIIGTPQDDVHVSLLNDGVQSELSSDVCVNVALDNQCHHLSKPVQHQRNSFLLKKFVLHQQKQKKVQQKKLKQQRHVVHCVSVIREQNLLRSLDQQIKADHKVISQKFDGMLNTLINFTQNPKVTKNEVKIVATVLKEANSIVQMFNQSCRHVHESIVQSQHSQPQQHSQPPMTSYRPTNKKAQQEEVKKQNAYAHFQPPTVSGTVSSSYSVSSQSSHEPCLAYKETLKDDTVRDNSSVDSAVVKKSTRLRFAQPKAMSSGYESETNDLKLL